MASSAASFGTVLTQQIEARVRQHTYNRIRGLVVEEVDGRVVVRGRVPTRYTKQLALHAALELLTGDRFQEQIAVGFSGDRPPVAPRAESAFA